MNTRVRKSAEERSSYGKSIRKKVPRSTHAFWTPKTCRTEAIDLIENQNVNRLDWLVPVRRRRMMASPFAFFRGAASIMADDLSMTPVSGLNVQVCGDAHLANFGLFASPERKLVFDLNDFDETLEGPWEWDIKRLGVSFVIAAGHNSLKNMVGRKATKQMVKCYREAMRAFASKRMTDVWYAHINEENFKLFLDNESSEKRLKKTIARAKTRDTFHAIDRLTEEVDGEYRIRSEPPLLVPLRELIKEHREKDVKLIEEAFVDYKSSVSTECSVLLRNFQAVDFGLKVVGVGSVGTRCWILLLEGRDRNDPLFLQIKEATTSVLSEYLHPSPYKNHGRRIVEGQRLMQTVSDIFLGWTHTPKTGRHFYWRQLRDWKGSINIDGLDAPALVDYATACGWTLARAHARTGDPIAIASYLGSNDTFDKAITTFSERYAEQNQNDYEVFLQEIHRRQLEVAPEES